MSKKATSLEALPLGFCGVQWCFRGSPSFGGVAPWLYLGYLKAIPGETNFSRPPRRQGGAGKVCTARCPLVCLLLPVMCDYLCSVQRAAEQTELKKCLSEHHCVYCGTVPFIYCHKDVV